MKRAFDVLYAEGADRPRVMCIPLHPYITGAPGRIGMLDEIHIARHSDVWYATGSEIVDAYRRGVAEAAV